MFAVALTCLTTMENEGRVREGRLKPLTNTIAYEN